MMPLCINTMPFECEKAESIDEPFPFGATRQVRAGLGGVNWLAVVVFQNGWRMIINLELTKTGPVSDEIEIG